MIGSGAAVIGYLVQQQFLFPIAEIDVVFWLLAGIVVATTGPLRPVTRPPAVVAILLGSLSVIALLGGALDVAADHRVLDSQRNPLTAPATTDRAAALRPDSIRYWLAAADARARDGELPAANDRIDRALVDFASRPDPLGHQRPHPAGDCRIDRIRARTSAAAVGFYEKLLAAIRNNAQNQLRAGAAYCPGRRLRRGRGGFS